ncbi:unnamed protein product [Hermetia illucens]|uniref:P21-activated protein kinase-interacting protein 1-like n=1 Tax=Hermetia illucens TaxID=343691 RepID=A0A7R8V0L9_HERIL|nr:p21-activated protein kinase-interacting protein 1-like [Hermetia illucens]CAD7089921.1 unnamed protein product [Hermetia illucens]
MANLVEIIVGTYEEFILGYKVENDKTLTQSFATRSHTGSIRCVAVKEHYVASGGADDRIFIYDMKTRKEAQILHHHEGTVNALAFTPDASHLLTGADDGKMCAVRVSTWQVEGSWKKAHGGSPVTHISCHPSGKLALTLGNDQTLRTWNLIKGRLAYTTNLKTKAELGRTPDCLFWSPDGDHFTITGTRVIEIWSVKTAGIVKEIKCESKPVSVCWMDEQRIVVGFEDGNLWIFDFKAKAEPAVQEAHKQRVKAIAYVNDILATASSSGEVSLWKVKTKDNSIAKITSTNIGCRPTCLALLDLTQFGDDYALKLEDEEADEEVSDEQPDKNSRSKVQSVGNVIIEMEEDDEEDTPEKSNNDSGKEKTKRKKKQKKSNKQEDVEDEVVVKKKQKKGNKEAASSDGETSPEKVAHQKKRKFNEEDSNQETVAVPKKHKKKKPKQI